MAFSYPQNEVHNPSIPFIGNINGGVQVGKMIFVEGFVPHHSQSFSINMQCGNQIDPRSDCALHFNPRPSQGCVVRNSYTGYNWGSEEKGGGTGGMRPGHPFSVMILCEDQEWMVAVNGQHFCKFSHRLNKRHVNTLTVEGDVKVNVIRFQAQGMPGPPPPSHGGHPGHGHHGHHPPPPSFGPQPIYNPQMPYHGHIPGGFHPGKSISISGMPRHGAERFTVNLEHDHSTIPMHMDIRFHEGNVVVCNSKRHGNWENEERSYNLPFGPGVQFDMVIRCEHNNYSIFCNGQNLKTFNHRFPPHEVKALSVKGEANVHSITFL